MSTSIRFGGGDMTYYIYENWQAGPHKAVIHVGTCSFCNHGQGRSGRCNPGHARWHGPYETLDSARGASAALPGVVDHRDDRCI